ncbi:hypothetical protein [Xanthobacter tagetidis]|uniref:Uncharacterized protein n=1 Tax=Xanthobacter tagetidis TaxID=60216 RepID=A0A3L7AGC5_9HYPH|nr:hypothetical protein [Xanthobacter tagetidis]MBB6308514.1 hypothetical protein [Xanthobacter tagetidis]RLP78711.1 hypothetical protein D9R14_10665 [Xanthobacter tagetidis]
MKRPSLLLCLKALRGGAALLAALLTLAGPAAAQPLPPGVLAPGEAAVAGFSGVFRPTLVPPGADPADTTVIDLFGPSLRVVDLADLGGRPAGQFVPAPKPFTFTARQIGQVFAVALDNAVPPNIYAAATSAYGLPLIAPGSNGAPARARQGGPSAGFMPGLWGAAAPGGGPGSIWRIDGVTGAVTLFATVGQAGRANGGAALGGLAFDGETDTLYVADRETGFILRYGLDGALLGGYDHGTEGRAAAGLAPVAYDPAGRSDIASPAFDSTQPSTWGYAAPERRVFGLGIRQGRLYYAVAAGLEVWSIALSGPDRSPTRELSVPPGDAPSEISKITFDDQGRMILAERPAPTGAYDFQALAFPGTGRVLRYALYARYPGLARAWQPEPDSYAVGFPGALTNGNGGAAIGYDHDRTGLLDRWSCGGFLWTTGERLRAASDPAVAARLAATGPLEVDGLQGNDVWRVRPLNAPPLRSAFIDFDDRFDAPPRAGWMGDMAIWRVCGPALRGGWMLPGWMLAWWGGIPVPLPPQPDLSCPPDQQKPGIQCCPKGTAPGPNGQCSPFCPNGAMDPKSQQLCGLGFDAATYEAGNPAKLACIGGKAPKPGKGILGCVEASPVLSAPVCPAGFAKQAVPGVGTICQPTPGQGQCPPGQQLSPIDQQCHALCADGTAWPSTQCCAPGSLVTGTGQCCPAGALFDPKTGQCTTEITFNPCPPGAKAQGASGQCAPGAGCPKGAVADPKTGLCKKVTTACLPGLKPDPATGVCSKVPPKTACPPGQLGKDGACCAAGWSPNAAGGCCPPGQSAEAGGQCKLAACPPPGKMMGGKCCAPGDLKPGGSCAASLCTGGKVPVGSGPACCDPAKVYADAKGATACCAGKVVNGVCGPLGGDTAQPQCGSSDPNCCPAGYTAAGGACCLASQLTATGQCCPAGQAPSGPGNAQCGPAKTPGTPPGGTPPGGGTPGGSYCCAPGQVPVAGGICCAAGQVTSVGQCCPAGQQPDPRNRMSCVPAQSCGLRKTMVDGACCEDSHVYKDGAGAPRCCAQLVDQQSQRCPAEPIFNRQQTCPQGFAPLGDGACCPAGRVTRDGRCRGATRPPVIVPPLQGLPPYVPPLYVPPANRPPPLYVPPPGRVPPPPAQVPPGRRPPTGRTNTEQAVPDPGRQRRPPQERGPATVRPQTQRPAAERQNVVRPQRGAPTPPRPQKPVTQQGNPQVKPKPKPTTPPDARPPRQ